MALGLSWLEVVTDNDYSYKPDSLIPRSEKRATLLLSAIVVLGQLDKV